MRRSPTDPGAGCFARITGGLGTVALLVGIGMLGSKSPSVGVTGILLLFAAALLFIVCAVARATQKQARRDLSLRINLRAFRAPVIRIHPPRQRCPYCHDSIAGQTRECMGCKAVFHEECLQEARGCTTLGCAHAAPRRTVRM